MKTLAEYLNQLGWDTTELARQADINYKTAKRAVDGAVVSSHSARDIAEALSRATGATIQVGDIRGLVIRKVGDIDTP